MIKNLPQRPPELGRIRLGEKEEATRQSGGTYTKPGQLDTLRFSSNDARALAAIASQHGGVVRPWPDGEQTHELVSETTTIPVMLGADPIDCAYERWGSGGIARRCDGQDCLVPAGEAMAEKPCECMTQGMVPHEDRDAGACVITVRLRLILPDVPGLGIWLCTSHSYIAATELPAQVEMLQAVAERGRVIHADFAIEARTLKKPHEKYERRFNVPVLRIRESLSQLAGTAAPALAPAEPSTIESAPTSEPAPLNNDPKVCGLCDEPLAGGGVLAKTAGGYVHKSCTEAQVPA